MRGVARIYLCIVRAHADTDTHSDTYGLSVATVVFFCLFITTVVGGSGVRLDLCDHKHHASSAARSHGFNTAQHSTAQPFLADGVGSLEQHGGADGHGGRGDSAARARYDAGEGWASPPAGPTWGSALAGDSSRTPSPALLVVISVTTQSESGVAG